MHIEADVVLVTLEFDGALQRLVRRVAGVEVHQPDLVLRCDAPVRVDAETIAVLEAEIAFAVDLGAWTELTVQRTVHADLGFGAEQEPAELDVEAVGERISR